MKPFEEQYTAWIDGELTGAELAEFERALPDRAAAEADRAEARGCSELLRRHCVAPALANADFFSHQLAERIAAEERLARPAPAAPVRGRFFSLAVLAWACAFCVVGTGAYYAGQWDRFNRMAVVTPAAEEYQASILKTSTEDPAISASVYSDQKGATVLWLDGLDYLPASYKLQ